MELHLKILLTNFDVLLTVYLSIILATDQLNAQTLIIKQVYYIPLHVSSTVVLIIRRSKLYYTASGIVTLCRWPSGVPDGHLQSVTIPDAV